MDNHKKHDFSLTALLVAICKAQIPAFLTGMILLALFCLIACNLTDPDSVTAPLSFVAMLTGALAGGIAARRFSGIGLLSGLASGALTMLLCRAFATLPLPDSGMSAEHTAILVCLIPLVSVCGAVIGRKRRVSVKRRRH